MVNREKTYFKALSQNEYTHSFDWIAKGGNSCKTMRRVLQMYQYGGTIGYARYPLFRIPGCDRDRMLPRPVVKSRPYKGHGHTVMEETEWFIDLVQDVEDMVVRHLLVVGTEESKHILKWCHFSRTKIPDCLRICDTFFTQFVLVGSSDNDGKMPPHLDNDDHINAIVSVGDSNISGGATQYYNGVSKSDKGIPVLSIPFQHGRIQIGRFDSVYHGVDGWSGGRRGTFNFSVKKKLTKHFHLHDNQYYSQYVNAQYPSKMFVAT